MTSVRLGLRLALAPAARARTLLLVLASTVATVVVLAAAAAGRFELAHATAFQQELPVLAAGTVLAIALPCAVLVATVARLAAALRDRRLANLRLIGLTPAQTRVVAGTETGVAAGLGAVLGLVAWSAVRPLLVARPLAGKDWDATFAPITGDVVLVLLGLPALVVATALLPTRSTARDPLAISRRADRRPPGWWRLAPLAVGAGLCGTVVAQGHRTDGAETERQVVLFFVGTTLLAIGVVLVLPVLVRLLTRVLTRLPLGAATRIAVRRLEAQPAATARVIAALLVGLFLVTGARYVVAAFESTPQYRAAAYDVEHGERASTEVRTPRVAALVQALRADPAVRDVVALPALRAGRNGPDAVVATCADLARLGADIDECRDGEAAWLTRIDDMPAWVAENYPRAATDGELTWSAGRGGRAVPIIRTPTDLPTVVPGPGWDSAPVYADALLPPDLVGALPDRTRRTVVAIAVPGESAVDALFRHGADNAWGADVGEYAFVATLRGTLWTLAAVVLGVGLLALVVAAGDRAIQRRKEVTGLRLVGLSGGVLRRAQALETGLPVVLGALLAIGCGALAGAAYLTLDEQPRMPWEQTWTLAAAATLGGLLVAALTTAAATPRIRADEIRAE